MYICTFMQEDKVEKQEKRIIDVVQEKMRKAAYEEVVQAVRDGILDNEV